MGNSQLKATIKKIEIINKALKEEWHQSIRVVLGDIELNNENLIKLRGFHPDELVNVTFDSVQLNFEDLREAEKRSGHPSNEIETSEVVGEEEPTVPRSAANSVELLEVIEGDRPLQEGETVKNEFKF